MVCWGSKPPGAIIFSFEVDQVSESCACRKRFIVKLQPVVRPLDLQTWQIGWKQTNDKTSKTIKLICVNRGCSNRQNSYFALLTTLLMWMSSPYVVSTFTINKLWPVKLYADITTGSPSIQLVFSTVLRAILSRFYKTLYGDEYRVRKIVINWCKRHK